MQIHFKRWLLPALLLTATALQAQTPARPTMPPPDTIRSSAGPLVLTQLAALVQPWAMAWLPDGRLLVTEKPGRLRIYQNGMLSDPISGVPTVEYGGQGGLLDVAVDPEFATNSYIYLSYTERAPEQPRVSSDTRDPRLGAGQNLKDTVLKGGAVARGRLDGNTLKDVQVIWRQFPKTIGRSHYAVNLLFGPDSMLYITSGERQRFEPAQDLSTNLGKVVRINKDGSIPRDNPFVGRRGARADVWTLGNRNPLGIALSPANRIVIHEMGPWQGDELNYVEKGKNYGWPVVANGKHYNGAAIPHHDTRPNFAAPAYYWHPVISPSGMLFYSGSMFPEWNGHALIGGLSSQAVIRLRFEGDTVRAEERLPLMRRIRDVIQAPDGAIWVITDYQQGALLRIAPMGQ